jgi:glycosyltransferase involved in cell wall biosynthesis
VSVDVSVVIPVYNRPRLVREAVASALRQARGLEVEVVVVDDCSTDETWDVVQSLPVRALRMAQNGGRAHARNAAIDASLGRYVKFLDSDDVLIDGHLAREVGAMRTSNADIAVSGYLEEGARGEFTRREVPHFDSIIDDLLAGKSVATSAALYARYVLPRWDPSLRLLDDWDFFVQAALRAKRIVSVDGLAYEWRQHEGVRVTDGTMLENALSHHRILYKFEDVLRERGELTERRRKRLAQYFYKELRVLSLHDRPAFDSALQHIFELDPQFRPVDEERQWWMRFAARVIGTRQAVLLHSAVKRLIRG